MKLLTISPRDTALFRDARPFDGQAGAVSMPLPWPSAVAGLVRTHSFPFEGGSWQGTPDEARKIEVRGPWLVALDDEGKVVEHFVPAPADVLFYPDPGDTSRWTMRQLTPILRDGLLCSDQPEVGGRRLIPVTFREEPADAPGKPARGPAYWSWATMRDWLQAPSAARRLDASDREQLGVDTPAAEERVHVGIDPSTRTAQDGVLFTTSMRRFVQPTTTGLRRLAVAASVEDRAASHLREVVHLGGERRSSFATVHEDAGPPEAPALPEGTTRLRVVLVTPGLFADGWRPDEAQLGGGRLVGAAVGRPEAVSGWDMAAGGPRPSRRMAPAGSVYWVSFDDAAAAAEWASAMHFRSISSDEQDRRDGFGLVIVGVGS